MDSNYCGNLNIKQDFKQFTSSASAILREEQENQNQRIKISFTNFLNKAKIIIEGEEKYSSLHLRQKFFTFIKNAKYILRKDINSKITYLSSILEKLKQKYNRINIFSILSIERKEDPQSDFLAWLLNPNESHGFGDSILRAFLKKACDITENIDYQKLTIKNIKIVTRQTTRDSGVPDIVLNGDNFICVIENKVGAGETKKDNTPQTKWYANHYTKQVKKNDKLIFLYLVPPSRYEEEPAKQANDKRFKQMLYSDVVEIIESVLIKSIPPPEIHFLIEMFLYNIKRWINYEFEDYFEAENLLYEKLEDSTRVLRNSNYFAQSDKYELLLRLVNIFSKEVTK